MTTITELRRIVDVEFDAAKQDLLRFALAEKPTVSIHSRIDISDALMRSVDWDTE